FLVSRKSLYGYCNQGVFCSGRFKHRNSEGYEESSSSEDDLINTKGVEDDGRKKSHASFKDTLLGFLKNKSTNLIKDDIKLREGDTITKMVNDYYLVRFQCEEDYDTILTKAPWDPRYSSAMYTMSILNAIGNVFGRVDRVDYNTKNGSQRHFA
ncbi:hypothetical protein Goarm_006446, partial [Gossypium armourianum]|nr:hypothetical protein [Gossypium armourianum]